MHLKQMPAARVIAHSVQAGT